MPYFYSLLKYVLATLVIFAISWFYVNFSANHPNFWQNSTAAVKNFLNFNNPFPSPVNLNSQDEEDLQDELETGVSPSPEKIIVANQNISQNIGDQLVDIERQIDLLNKKRQQLLAKLGQNSNNASDQLALNFQATPSPSPNLTSASSVTPTPTPTPSPSPSPNASPNSSPTPTPTPQGGGGGGGGATQNYDKILISEAQTEGETTKDEFVELYNPNNLLVDLNKWILRKKTAGGNESALVSSTKFSGTVLPLSYFLVANQNYTGTSIPDIFYSSDDYSIAENNTILLYNPNNQISDKVGFGSANDFESVVFSQNPEKSKSLGRKWIEAENKYQDTDNNSLDFEIQDSTPKAKNQNYIFPTPTPSPLPSPSPENIPSIPVITSHTDGQILNSKSIFFAGTASSALDIFIDLNGFEFTTGSDQEGLWGLNLDLNEGNNTIQVWAKNNAGESDKTAINILADTTPPTVVFGDLPALQTATSITISWMFDDILENASSSGFESFYFKFGAVPDNIGLIKIQEVDGVQQDLTKDAEVELKASSILAEVLDNHTFTFSVKAEDKAENEGEWFAYNVEINSMPVVINEIAWMGTASSANDEWIELFNNSNQIVNLDGWSLKFDNASSVTIINLSNSINSQGFYLLERNDEDTLPDIISNMIYHGILHNTGDNLFLNDKNGNTIDMIPCVKNTDETCEAWFAGKNETPETRKTMERIDPKLPGDQVSNWTDSSLPGGTPKAPNSYW